MSVPKNCAMRVVCLKVFKIKFNNEYRKNVCQSKFGMYLVVQMYCQANVVSSKCSVGLTYQILLNM